MGPPRAPQKQINRIDPNLADGSTIPDGTERPSTAAATVRLGAGPLGPDGLPLPDATVTQAAKLLSPDLADIARQAAMSGALGKTKRSNGRAASFLGGSAGGSQDVLGSTSALGGSLIPGGK